MLGITQERGKATRMQQIEEALTNQSEVPEPTKRKRGESHADQSGVGTSSHTSGNIAVEIASERARQFDNNQTVARSKNLGSFSKRTIIEIRDCIGKSMFCAPCWLHDYDAEHNFSTCHSIAAGWALSGSLFRSMRSMQLPTKHCWECCLPQVC